MTDRCMKPCPVTGFDCLSCEDVCSLVRENPGEALATIREDYNRQGETKLATASRQSSGALSAGAAAQAAVRPVRTKNRLAPYPVWSVRPDGSVRDLAEPDPVEIDFFAMANTLSKIARFNGSNPGVAYSVAQHSVMGADAILNETGDPRLAALFLLHDGEEHLLGDKPTPAQRLLVAALLGSCEPNSGHMASAFWGHIKDKWREAGWFAAGLGLPTEAEQQEIDEYDRLMCNAEMVALFGPAARAQALPVMPRSQPLRLKGGIKPWAPMKAEERFIEAAKRLIGEETLYEQRELHAAHVELSLPHGSHAAGAAEPAAARQTIAGVRSDTCPSGRKSSDRTGRKT